MTGLGLPAGPQGPNGETITADTSEEMSSLRICRSCRAPLRGDVRWCLQCHARVRELAAREPIHQGDFVAMPRDDVVETRLGGGPTALSLGGRMWATVLVLAVGALIGLALWGFVQSSHPLFWAFVIPAVALPIAFTAIRILRAVWRPVPTWHQGVDEERPRVREILREARALPSVPLTARRAARWIAAGLGIGLVGGLSLFGPDQVQAVLLGVAAFAGCVFALRWTLRRDD